MTKKRYKIAMAILLILNLICAYLMGIEYAYAHDRMLYNAKIESYVPVDMTKHKAPNYRLLGKG